MSVTSPADAKMALRRAMLERRRAAHLAQAQEAALALSANVIAELDLKGKNIAGYWPLGDEIDCRPALEASSKAGAIVALPVVAGQGQVLIFRAWRPGDVLEQGPFGTMHPNVRSPVVCPQILLVPLIAYDLEGGRLGYGAGYYDRTIANLRAQGPARDGAHAAPAREGAHPARVTAIGLAYDVQRVDAVPVDAHDQPLDAVITNSGTIWFG
jgi:5-formyltetrahydrofolate cyclo-ligase